MTVLLWVSTNSVNEYSQQGINSIKLRDSVNMQYGVYSVARETATKDP